MARIDHIVGVTDPISVPTGNMYYRVIEINRLARLLVGRIKHTDQINLSHYSFSQNNSISSRIHLNLILLCYSIKRKFTL